MEMIKCCLCSDLLLISSYETENVYYSDSPESRSKLSSIWTYMYHKNVRESLIPKQSISKSKAGDNFPPRLTFTFTNGNSSTLPNFDLTTTTCVRFCKQCAGELEILDKLHSQLEAMKRNVEAQVDKISNICKKSDTTSSSINALFDHLKPNLGMTMAASVAGKENVLQTLNFLNGLCSGIPESGSQIAERSQTQELYETHEQRKSCIVQKEDAIMKFSNEPDAGYNFKRFPKCETIISYDSEPELEIGMEADMPDWNTQDIVISSIAGNVTHPQPQSHHHNSSVQQRTKYRKYDKQQMQLAVNAVREGNSVLATAKNFNIPSRTLYECLKKHQIKPPNSGWKSQNKSTHANPKGKNQVQNQSMDDSESSPSDILEESESDEEFVSRRERRRIEKRKGEKYKRYTLQDLEKALEATRNGMSPLQAAKMFRIPSRTLYARIQKLQMRVMVPKFSNKNDRTETSTQQH